MANPDIVLFGVDKCMLRPDEKSMREIGDLLASLAVDRMRVLAVDVDPDCRAAVHELGSLIVEIQNVSLSHIVAEEMLPAGSTVLVSARLDAVRIAAEGGMHLIGIETDGNAKQLKDAGAQRVIAGMSLLQDELYKLQGKAA